MQRGSSTAGQQMQAGVELSNHTAALAHHVCASPAVASCATPLLDNAAEAAHPNACMQVREQQAQHVLEMDALHTRVAAVVAKKDALIGRLRSQLADSAARTAALEEVMQVQGEELLTPPAMGAVAAAGNSAAESRSLEGVLAAVVQS